MPFASLPAWIERLLGIDAEAGEGIAWNIDVAWGWPPWLTVAALALGAALIVGVYLREGPGVSRRVRLTLAAIRLSLLAVLLMMIAQATLVLERTGLPLAALLLDDSQSMTAIDHYPQKMETAMRERLRQSDVEPPEPSRWNLLRAAFTEDGGELLRGIADRYRPRIYYLTGPKPLKRQDTAGILDEIRTAVPAGESTRLGIGVQKVLDDLRGATPAALILVTDGINTDGPPLADAAKEARRRGVPLFIVGLGSGQPVRDLALSDLLTGDVVFLGDIVEFECTLSAHGLAGRNATVTLRQKGNPAVLSKLEVAVPADGESCRVRLPYRPEQPGQFDLVVEAEPLDGENRLENNRLARSIEVRKEKIRVLLADGRPRFEYRYLHNMFARDETIVLSAYLQDADLEHAKQDASALRAFPARRDDLFAYDVVILGDLNPVLLGPAALQHLAEFVDRPEKGGSLVLVAGSEYMPAAYGDTPLAKLLPFASPGIRMPAAETSLADPFVVRPTDLGLATPPLQLGDTPDETEEIWRSLPPLYWLGEFSPFGPGVLILAEHPTRRGPDGRLLPVIGLQYVGAGKVLFHATDETWRWRYRAGDLYFGRYWGQMIRYLSRAKLTDAARPITLSTDRREYVEGDSARLRVRFADERLAPAADDGVAVIVERSGRQTQRIALRRDAARRGLFEGALGHPVSGDYRAWIAAPIVKGSNTAIDFRVAPPAGELADSRVDLSELSRLAEQAGGRFYTFETVRRLPDDLPPGSQVPIESLPPRPLWNRWPVLALFLGLLIAEWILRKRRGLV